MKGFSNKKNFMNESIKPNKVIKIIKVLFISLAIVLLINWLFHPVLGVYYNPCIVKAIYGHYAVFPGQNDWVVLFTKTSIIKEIYYLPNGCGYQYSGASGEVLNLFGISALGFIYLLIDCSYRNRQPKNNL
jgi:hypothetical protein